MFTRHRRHVEGLQARVTELEGALAASQRELSDVRRPLPAAPDDAGFVDLALPDGRRYTLSIGTDTGDSHRNWIAATGAQDPEWKVCMALLRAGDVFLDVGAHFGAFGIPAAVAGAQVHAFELLAANVQHMGEAVGRNRLDNIRLVQAAVSDRPGAVEFGGTSAWGMAQPGSRIAVAALRIDDYVAQLGLPRVDVMKIDVEGSEHAALLGAADVIGRDHPDIVIECNTLTCGTAGYSYRTLLRLLSDRGYQLLRIRNGALQPWSDSVPQEAVVCDYLATVRPLDAVAQRVGWPVRAMARDELVASVLRQDEAGDHHRMHLLAVEDRLPEQVRNDPGVAALFARLRPLAGMKEMELLRTGAG